MGPAHHQLLPLARWVKDRSRLRAQSKAPFGKAMPIINDDFSASAEYD